MKKLTIGIAAAAMLASAVPAMAQVGFYAGPGGVGVQVGSPYYDYYAPRGYYDYYRGPVWHGHPGWHHHHWHR